MSIRETRVIKVYHVYQHYHMVQIYQLTPLHVYIYSINTIHV